jgi:hypothetical protein
LIITIINVTLKDKNSTKSLFDKLGWLSFNQINAQIKLTEAWKMERVRTIQSSSKKECLMQVSEQREQNLMVMS